MEKIKILHVLGSLSFGGIESMLLNFHKVISKESFQMDYVTCSTEVSEMEKALICEGARIYHITRRRTNIIKHILEMFLLFKEKRKEYDIIQVHMNNEAYLPLIIATILGYRIRVAHSHTSYIGKKMDYISKFKCYLTTLFSTNYVACSMSAAEFLFGKKNLSKVYIMHNCILYKDYLFDITKRCELRKKYFLENRIIIGYVSRLDVGKNHEYICKLAQRDKMKKCLFLIIGDGSEYSFVENKIQEYNVEENVKLVGKRNDVAEILNILDLFVMPSEHEGFPIVLIEAQVNGLPCIVSKYVSEEVNLGNKMFFLDIKDENLYEWEEKIIESISIDRTMTCNQEYDAECYIKKVENYYLGLLKKVK